MARKRIIACILAFAVTIAVLLFFSRLTMPKYTESSREGNLISEYYRAIDNGERHDVIFIGDCEAYSSFCPVILWEECGITSFVRGSPSQSMAQSYHILCETLELETPTVVVFSVYALCREGGAKEAYNRMTLDGMRPSVYKLRAVLESKSYGESALSYFLPLLRFHSRWGEISYEDIKYFFSSPAVSHNGYFLRLETVPFEEMEKNDVAPYDLPWVNFEYLDKMREVCKRTGVELVLVKAPLDSWRYPWYAEWSEEIKKYADRYDIKYYDLTENIFEIGIDTEEDSYDGGLHLNVYGAEKTTRFLSEKLKRYISVPHTEEERRIWSIKRELYYKERNKDD